MPVAEIEVRRERRPAEVQAFIRAVYEAQREALKVPENHRRAGAPSDGVVALPDPPLANWGLRGVPATEVQLGCKLKV